MKRLALTAAGALVLVACTHQPEAATETPPPASGVPRVVVFYAEGDGTRAAAVTMRTESGGTIQKNVALPMGDAKTGKAGVESTLFKRGDQLYISVQNTGAAGSVTCRIEVDGKTVDEATSSGAGSIASCRGTMP